MKDKEQIKQLAEIRYGNDPHKYGGQRDGFKEGYKQAQSEQLNLSSVSNSVVCSHESYAYTLNNDAKICDDCDAIFY